MRHPYDESGTWVANLGPAYTGLGSGGTNTVQWSIRTSADAAVGGYDWTTGVLELAGGEGQYLVLFPANVVGAAGRYVIRVRSASSSGKHVSEELIFGAPQYVGSDTSGTTTLLARLTSTRAGLLDNLDATVSSRLATSGYTTPPTAAAVMAAVLDELAASHNTAGTVGKLIQNLDAAVSSRSTYAGADTAGTTTLLSRLTSGRATNLDNLDAAVSGIAAAVWASGTRTLSSFGTLVTDIWAAGTRSLTDKAGFALSSAGVQAVWDALVVSLTTVNSIGKRIVDNLDAAASSRSSQSSVDALGSPLQEGDYTAPPSASSVAAAVWDRLTSALTTAGSVGKFVTDRIDVVLSTRFAASDYTAPDNTGIAAVQAKTDNLPASPAATGDIPTPAAISDEVWDEPVADHTVAGSTGQALTAIGSPWDDVAADHDTDGTMGAIINDAGGWVDPLQNPIQIGKAALLTFNFGPAKTGLSTVGFQFYNPDGTTFGPRHTGVVELGHGSYQATYTWDAEWQGSLIADTGTISPAYTDAAALVVQAPARVAVDFSGVEDRLDEIEEDVDQIPAIRVPS